MVYTVQMDLIIDDEEVYPDEAIKDLITEAASTISASVDNIRVIDISD